MVSEAPRASSPLTDAYERWRASRLGQITDRLQQQTLSGLIGEVDGLRVLDVGCGDGVFAIELAKRGGIVTGLDPDPTMLQAAEARALKEGITLTLEQGEAGALPFPDAAFDRVVAVTVLCFIPDAEQSIAEMARVLRPGGRLIVGELGRWNVWAAQRRIQGWMGNSVWRDAYFRTASELRRLVTRHGLTACETRGATFYPPSGAAASRLATIDPWLGRRTTLGAAFIAQAAQKGRRAKCRPQSFSPEM
ncbi:class I SAM-dependent methyltransferase [Filomicrobium sp.]|uniref:class I SAM-dependent methyltransferase n=1 Tax=Filomicrobium sp. TaxID=2024831 RepID=UPI0025909D57|nr:class I SAM-dependent methyltransferase [Filomicrobium sp.]